MIFFLNGTVIYFTDFIRIKKDSFLNAYKSNTAKKEYKYKYDWGKM